MHSKIGSFELLFQKAGKRTLTYYVTNNVGEYLETKKLLDLPNIVYCYSKTENALFVLDENIKSINEIKSNTKIYSFHLPNMIWININRVAFHGVCISRGEIYNVEHAATYFLSSSFTAAVNFGFNRFRILKTTRSKTTTKYLLNSNELFKEIS